MAAERYEPRDANSRAIFGVVVAVAAIGLVIHLAVGWRLRALEKKPAPRDGWPAAVPAAIPGGVPRLQVSPASDLREFRRREETALTRYGWTDRTGGVVRLPVDRAMELLLARGLPVRTNAEGRK